MNSIHGGVILPRGTSIVGLDLRKTKVRPKYVPDPENDNIERSCLFRVTGGCYLWQFSMFDGDPNGKVFKDYTANEFVPNFSHHKLACFEYADGVNEVKINDEFIANYTTDRTDLTMYYEKVGLAYGQSSGRAIEPDYPSTSIDIQSKIDEYESTGLSKQESELKGVEEFALECSILKVAISEDMQICADEGIQIFGGMGFSAEAPIESAWRDARIGRIYEGTNEINRMLIIGMLLKKAMKGNLDIMTPYQNILNNEPLSIDEKCDDFEDEIILVENIKKIFLLLLGKAFEKYGPEIDKNQQVLLSLSDLAIEAYLSESTLKRTIKNINRTSLEDQYDQINMTKLYIYEACQIVLKKSNDVINSIVDTESQDKILSSITNRLKYRKNPNVFELKTKIADKIISENKYCF